MTRARMRSRLATEWEAMGWEWDMQVGGLILDRIEMDQAVTPETLAVALPESYLARYRTDRETLAEVIDRAIGGETVEGEKKQHPGLTILVHGDNHMLSFGDNAQLDGSHLNVGAGSQINLDAGADKKDLLLALRALVASGLAGEWDSRAAAAIGRVVDETGVLTVDDVRGAVIETGEAQGVDRSRVQELIERIATGGLGGFLSTALTAGLSDLAHLIG